MDRIVNYCRCEGEFTECKCKHEFNDITDVDWIKMPVKFCCKCNHYEYAYQDNLEKNIGFISGYNGECGSDN